MEEKKGKGKLYSERYSLKLFPTPTFKIFFALHFSETLYDEAPGLLRCTISLIFLIVHSKNTHKS